MTTEGEPKESAGTGGESSADTFSTDECLAHARQIYRNVMKRHYGDKEFMSPAKLTQLHGQIKNSLRKQWSEQKSGLTTNLKIENLENDLDELLEIYHFHNNLNKTTADGKISPAIGIQLKRNSCCVSVFYQGQVHIIPNPEDGGNLKIPAYVEFNEDGSEVFGLRAQQNARNNSPNTIYDLISIIGRPFADPEFQNDMKSWPFTMQEEEAIPQLMVYGKLIPPEEVLGKLLAHLRGVAEAHLKLEPGSITKASVVVPVSLNSSQRQATENAGKLAGFEVIQILNEPSVAPSAYHFEGEKLFTKLGKVMVYDLGGESLTITLLDMESITVLSHEVLPQGGQDLDNKIIDYCTSSFQAKHGIDLFAGKGSAQAPEREEAERRLSRLRSHCEKAKMELTFAPTVHILVDGITEALDLDEELTRDKFEELAKPVLDSSIEQLQKVLTAASVTKDDVKAIVLVGGSSRIPKVQEMLDSFFGRKLIKNSVNPEFVVAHGAAVQAVWLHQEKEDPADIANQEGEVGEIAEGAKEDEQEDLDLPKTVLQEFKIANTKLCIDICEREYNELMKLEASHAKTVAELKEAREKVSATLAEYTRRNCSIGDGDEAAQAEHDTRVGHKQDLASQPNRLKWLNQNRNDVMNTVASRTTDAFTSMMNSATEKWLREHLTPDNISEVKTIYDLLSKEVLGGDEDVPSNKLLWDKLQHIFREECKLSYTAYLEVIHERLLMFYEAVENKFTSQSCFTSDELENCFQEEYEKVSEVLLGNNLEIYQLVDVGCEKLMGYFREQNKEIIANELLISKKLMPEILNFYDEEMKRILEEDIYPPGQLKAIHSCLVDKLVEELRNAFNFTAANNICENVVARLDTLRGELGQNFVGHLRQNQIKSKLVEVELNKILEASKSSYGNLVDAMMERSPDGLDPSDLEREHSEIVGKAREELNIQIREKTGQGRQLETNLSTLQVHIDEYWAFTSELNNLNLKRKQLSEEKARKLSAQDGPSGQVTDDDATQDSASNVGITYNEGLYGVEGDQSILSAKNELLRKCTELKTQLGEGIVFQIKSSIVRAMFAKRIEGAINCAESPESTLAQVEGHMAELVKWSSKYSKSE